MWRNNKVFIHRCAFTAFIFLLVACNPATKEAYLSDFEKFVERVDKYHEDYNKKDWQWADSRFQKYSEEWYEKFENQLTDKEEVKIFELKLKYTAFKNKNSLEKIYRKLIKKDVDEAKEKIDDYIEKDLDEDVEKLIDGATEIGDSAVRVLEEAIEKIENRF